MTDTGILEILSAAFGGVSKILLGKKYPQVIRELRMLVDDLLGPIFVKYSDTLHSVKNLREILESIATQSRTSKLWIECLMIPVFVMMTCSCRKRFGLLSAFCYC